MVTVPDPFVIPVVVIETSPAPPIDKFVLVPVIPPVILFVPASAFILAAADKVITPPQTFVPEIKRNAPSLEIPVPDRLKASAPTDAPCNCKAAPLATVTPPAVVPVP